MFVIIKNISSVLSILSLKFFSVSGMLTTQQLFADLKAMARLLSIYSKYILLLNGEEIEHVYIYIYYVYICFVHVFILSPI
jgi:hypothetical protein